MELTFTKNLNNEFVAEFEATADFNLHVENILPRDITLLQRTAGGKYDVVRDFPQNPPLSNVMDYDFTALVYPKMIKIVSEVEPTYASVVSDGEVTEIKSQSKEIEVTSNGTTVVEPDAGFAYLNKVSVKTNVEGQGGGESNDVEYISFKDELRDEAISLIIALSLSVRIELEEGGITARLVVPSYTYAAQYSQYMPSAVKFNRNEKMNMPIGMDGSGNPIIQSFTAVEYIGMSGQAFADKLNSLPRLTEEQFYAL